MISLPVGTGRFNYRTAGVWIDEGHVLLQGDTREEDFWALPGGRVEHMETAEGALLRELHEELVLGEETRIGRLLWVMQNFFSSPDWGGEIHELCMCFLVTPGVADVARLADKRCDHPCAEPDSSLRFRWFRLAELPATQVMRPTFLNRALLDLPATPMLITHDDH